MSGVILAELVTPQTNTQLSCTHHCSVILIRIAYETPLAFFKQGLGAFFGRLCL